MKAKTYLEKMGLKPVDKLNTRICRDRVSYLNRKIHDGKFSGELLKKAKYYAAWYGWMADHGGTRAAKKTTKKAA